MPSMSGPPGDFIGSMYITGYLKVIAGFQVAGGALLLIGRYVPLGLTLLGPVIVNIVLFHSKKSDSADITMAIERPD